MVRSVFFFQAEDGIRDSPVTGVQTYALPISEVSATSLKKTEWFSLEISSGSTLKVLVNKDLGEFTPSHLRSHMITGQPVEVTFIKKQNGEGTIVAVSVRDYE